NTLLVLAFKNDGLVSKTGGRIKNIQSSTNNTAGIPKISAELAVIAALSDRKCYSSGKPIVMGGQADGHKIIFDDMGICREKITAELMWVPVDESKKVVLCWQIYFIPKTTSDYWMVRVNAMDNSIVDMNNLTTYCNWGNHHEEDEDDKNNNENPESQDASTKACASQSGVDNASYRVIPYPAESPIHPGGTPTIVTNPWENAPGNATSLKWHSTGTVDYSNSRGNNVWANEDRKGTNSGGNTANSATSSAPLSFDFTPNFLQSPTQTAPNPNQQFSITNLFYWNNVLHDISYIYGFDEAAGNFQVNNMGRGGLGNDPVLADAQDGGGTNNANFATPLDGSSPRMQMYLWNGNPQKDGSVDNGIVAHEFAHGISTRLTGGASQVGCISNDESMSEGWSDYYGLMFTQDWANSNLNTGFNNPRSIGTYAIGQTPGGSGLRTKRYCTDFAVNDKIYSKSIDAQVHTRGELWCAVLWDMTWNIINQTGKISPTLYKVNDGGGNTIALKLVTEGLKLQPCFPGFIDGRDAILKADEILYGGIHSCSIKEAFRRRGMGAYASQGSSTSITDQTADFSSGDVTLLLTQNITQVPEGQNIIFTNTISAGNCSGISNYLLTDTLPTNVTYVSGGTYNPANRVVSFPVNIGAGQIQQYIFSVKVNSGSYFPTVNLFEDSVTQTAYTNKWVASPASGKFWSVSKKRSFSPQSSYYSSDPINASDLFLTLKTPIALGANPPKFSFRHWYNTEYTYDGGVLEISTDGGSSWKDLQNNIIEGSYNATMDASSVLSKRKAWTGNSNDRFIKSVVDLKSYANNNILLRFRFTTDLGTNLEGWYIDEIRCKEEPLVEMKSNLFNTDGKRISLSDTTTSILPFSACESASIVSQPKNTKACVNGSATFEAIAGGSSIVYSWQVSKDNGLTYNEIPSASGKTLTLNNLSTDDNNNLYRMIAENNCPSSMTSNSAKLSVSDPITITNQPKNLVLCAQENASFSVETSSPGKIQWQFSTDGGNEFIDIPNENSSVLTINNVFATMNGEQYRVSFESCDRNEYSAVALLTVNSGPFIIEPPVDISACTGNNVTINANIEGTSLSFQWQESTDGGASYTDLINETGMSLTLNNVSGSMNNYRYRITAKSAACPGTVTSNASVLTVGNTTNILEQPVSTSSCKGDVALFKVNAEGPKLTYQWQVSTDIGNSYTDLSNEKNASLVLQNVTNEMNNNLYRVLIGSDCSTKLLASDSVMLTVYPLTAITEQPKNAGVCLNGNVSFNGNAVGNALSYQWQVSSDGGNTFSDMPNENTKKLTISNASLSLHNNRYRLQVKGVPCGSTTSGVALLSVTTPAVINEQPKDTAVCEKNQARFSVKTSGSNLGYQWQVSNDIGNTFSNIGNGNESTLIISNTSLSLKNNLFKVIVSEINCGSVSSDSAILMVNALPAVKIVATPSNAVLPGQTITLAANTSSVINSYKWYLNGNLINSQNGDKIIIGSDKTGNYSAMVTDNKGCSTMSESINVKDSAINATLIYPNPNKGRFVVRNEVYESNNKGRTIKMFDSKGALVFSNNYTVSYSYQPMEVVANELSDGLYLLMLTDEKGNVLKSSKLIITR
ncbi:MAG: T9SS type A sorting domain-containing protein, partial [Ferruginibacter sp.]|nr:T9SS type A sorting domain-containing protein [Ferruginibacter sp.]